MSGKYTGRIVKLEPERTSGNPDLVLVEDRAAPAGENRQFLGLKEEAEEAARKIIAEAQDEAAAILARAEAEGEVRGREQAAVRFFELSGEFDDRLASMEGDIANLVSTCVERILAKTPQRDVIAGVVRAAIRDLRKRRAMTLAVAAEDIEMVRLLVERCQNWHAHPIQSVEIDHALQQGECRLSDGRNELRIDVDTQLAALRLALNPEDAADDSDLAG